MALESMMAATNRRRSPQSGHSSTSMSRPRRMSSAQVRLYEAPTFLGLLADGSLSTLAGPKTTTTARHQDSCRCSPLRFQRVSGRSPWSGVANGVDMLAAATLGACVTLLSPRPPPRISRRR
jgi:hypothetical protein